MMCQIYPSVQLVLLVVFVSVFVLLSLFITCLIYPSSSYMSPVHILPYLPLSASIPSASSCRYSFFIRCKEGKAVTEVKTGCQQIDSLFENNIP